MRPMLKTTIALAVAGMMSGAFAATTVKADKENVQHQAQEGEEIALVSASKGFTASVTGGNISIKNVDSTGAVIATGTPSDNTAIAIGTAETESVSIIADSVEGSAIKTTAADVTVRGKHISISGGSKNTGGWLLNFSGYGTAAIGGDETLDVMVSGGDTGLQLLAYNKQPETDGVVQVRAQNSISIVNTNYGIWAQNNSTGREGHYARISLDAEEILISARDAAITSFSQGYVELTGNVRLEAPDAILARGDSVVRINADNGGHSTKIDGNINFNYDEETSKTSVNAFVDINLSGSDSYWTGNTLVSWGSGKPTDETKLEVNDAHVTLSDGAQWNPTVVEADESRRGLALNKLTLNQGIINVAESTQTVEVSKLNGTGGTLNLAAEKTEDAFTMSSLSVEDASAMNLSVNIVGEGVNADTLTAADLDQAAKSAVTGAGASSVTQTQRVAEGDLRGAITQQVAADGTVASRSQADNTKMEALKGVTAASLVQWRNQVNHLTKRLGDVRRQSGDIGAWARVYGGEYKWGDENRVDMTSTTVQAGADARVGDWIVGGAFSYTDSSFDLRNGDGDGELYSLAVYGTRMFESGTYVDFVGRYGYIKNDMKAGNMDLDFDSNAFSVSAEAGHEFKFLGSAFVEPQVELAYGYVQGDDATASNGVKVHQDDYQNLVTRIGVRTGFDFPKDAGTIYAHASYAYDFLGDADGSARKAGDRVSLDEDLGGGWVTYGVGAQFRLGKSTFAYGDLERLTGGDVDNPWAFNVGFRHLF